MNRAYLIIFLSAALVALGYIFILRYMGFAPGYPRLVAGTVLFASAMYWVSARTANRRNPGSP